MGPLNFHLNLKKVFHATGRAIETDTARLGVRYTKEETDRSVRRDGVPTFYLCTHNSLESSQFKLSGRNQAQKKKKSKTIFFSLSKNTESNCQLSRDYSTTNFPSIIHPKESWWSLSKQFMQTNIKHSYLYWHHVPVNPTEPRPDATGPSLSLCFATLEAAQWSRLTPRALSCNV